MVGGPVRAYAAVMTTAQPKRAGRVLPGLARLAWKEPASGGRLRPPARDIVIAALITLTAVAGSYAEAHPSRPTSYFAPPHHLPHTPTMAMLLVAAAGAALAWQRRYPQLVVCVTTALVVAFTLPGYVNGTAVLLPAVALGMLAAKVPMRWSVTWTVVVTVVLMAATWVSNPFGGTGGGFLVIPANDAVGLFAGIAIASRHGYVEAVRVQSARRAVLETQRGIDEERLRIARELHDVVAHSMATITVQAAAASQLLHDRPDDAAESLRAIRAASKDGLRELRAILNVLRSASGGQEPGDPTQPAPGLSRLDALVSGVSAAGLPVTLTSTGRARDLAVVTDLSAFRIIQEALTNTLRHAGSATAAVTVDFGAEALLIEVTDTGAGLTDSAAEAAYATFLIDAGYPVNAPVTFDPELDRSAASQGHGLRGMRERAAAAGGTVDIGPLSEGGFRVAASLPYDPPPAAAPPLTADPARPQVSPAAQNAETGPGPDLAPATDPQPGGSPRPGTSPQQAGHVQGNNRQRGTGTPPGATEKANR